MNNLDFDWSRVPEQFVVFDLETTGLDATSCEIIEIGALKFDKTTYKTNGTIDSFQCFIKQSESLPSNIVQLTEITDEMLKTGDDLKTGLSDFLKFVDGRTLVAYNAKFDIGFLRSASKKTGVKLPRPLNYECALELAREKITGLENYKLKTVASFFQVNTGDAHRALGDCMMTLHTYINCYGVNQRLKGNRGNKSYRSKDTSSPISLLDILSVIASLILKIFSIFIAFILLFTKKR